MGWYGWLYILFMIPTDELLNPPRNLKTLFCCSLLISKLLCLWHGWMFLSISDRLMRKPQTRRPPHTRRLLVERNSLPSCYMNFGSSMQMMYYTTPLNKFTRFLDEHPDFVCAFCSCCSTGSGDCWSEGQSKGCYGDLSKQIYWCYRVTRQAFWGCVHSSVTWILHAKQCQRYCKVFQNQPEFPELGSPHIQVRCGLRNNKQ